MRDAPRPTRSILAATVLLAAAPILAQTPPPTPDPHLRPGDVVRLRIWREADLSGEFPVHADGSVVFPRLGRIEVTGTTTEQLQARLTREYETYLQNPSIEIVLLRRINILGEVKQPGLYTVDATMSVRDALALAGGFTSQANPNEIELVRGGRSYQMSLEAGSMDAVGLQSGDQINVPLKGWWSRNGAVMGSVVTAILSLVVALAR